ncbi:hypothetical protein C8R47DRAFT_1084658 [Mycena vitilis]|nr:hypothetical protein C8R47DRAFT_1084658 [Mycena vitilis]
MSGYMIAGWMSKGQWDGWVKNMGEIMSEIQRTQMESSTNLQSRCIRRWPERSLLLLVSLGSRWDVYPGVIWEEQRECGVTENRHIGNLQCVERGLHLFSVLNNAAALHITCNSYTAPPTTFPQVGAMNRSRAHEPPMHHSREFALHAALAATSGTSLCSRTCRQQQHCSSTPKPTDSCSPFLLYYPQASIPSCLNSIYFYTVSILPIVENANRITWPWRKGIGAALTLQSRADKILSSHSDRLRDKRNCGRQIESFKRRRSSQR